MTGHSQATPSGVGGQVGVGASFATPLMSRVLGGLFAAGGTLALLTVLLPHSAQAYELGLLIIVGNAYLVAGVLLWLPWRVPPWLLQVALTWGSTLITGVAYFSAGRPSPLIFFYLWVFLYSAYFFTKMQAAGQIAYVGVRTASFWECIPQRKRRRGGRSGWVRCWSPGW